MRVAWLCIAAIIGLALVGALPWLDARDDGWSLGPAALAVANAIGGALIGGVLGVVLTATADRRAARDDCMSLEQTARSLRSNRESGYDGIDRDVVVNTLTLISESTERTLLDIRRRVARRAGIDIEEV